MSVTTEAPSTEPAHAPPSGRSRSRIRPTWEAAALLALLLVGGAFRFVGISHDLDFRGPFVDESHNFVEPALRMWRNRTSDPGAYQGYPGFFNYLILAPVAIGDRLGGQFGAYLGARSVGAFAGLCSILLAHRLAKQLFGALAGLVAAALLTCSRGEVSHAHNVSPDLVVVAAMFGMFLLLRASQDLRRARLAGALVGAATAVKYSGLLLVPGLVAGVLAGANRPRQFLVQSALGAVVGFAVTAPHTVAKLGGDADLAGAVRYYFAKRAGGSPERPGAGIETTWSNLALNIGPAGLALAAICLGTQPWRSWAGLFGLVLANTLVMSQTELLYPRHILLMSAATSVLAAGGAAGLLRTLSNRRARVVAASSLMGVLLVPTTRRCVDLVERYRRPSPTEQLERWLEVSGAHGVAVSSWHFPRGVRGLELRRVTSLRNEPAEILVEYDFAVASFPGELGPQSGLVEIARFAPADDPGNPLVLLGPSAEARGRRSVSPAATPGSGCLPAARSAWDGDPGSWCRLAAGTSLEAAWSRPIALKRVEVILPRQPSFPLRFKVAGLASDGWRELQMVSLRPTRPRLQTKPWGQSLVASKPVVVSAVRITLLEDTRWDVAEVRVFEEQPTNQSLR